MADMIDGQILEGMYSGIEEKIDEIKQELSLELEINSTQIEASLKDTLESMMNEVRYITQQNSAIYDLSKADINALKEDLEKSMGGETVEKAIADLKAQMDELNGIISSLSNKTPAESAGGEANGDQIGAAVDSINARLQFEVESLKNELMGAMAQLAVSVTPTENAGAVDTDNFDAAVGALYEKMDAQSNEVGGLKGEISSLKDELMSAVAQLASENAPEENKGSTDNEKLNAAVSAIYEKLEAQAGEMGGLKGDLNSLKNELMDAMAQLAVSSATDENAGAINDDKLNTAMGALYEKMDAQSNEVGGLKGDLDSLKNELMDAVAQLAKTPEDNAGSTDTERLNAAVSAIYEKLEAQSNEVGGLKGELNSLKDELMNVMAQLAVSVAPDESTDNEKLNAAMSALYEKMDAQSGEVGGLKNDFSALKDDLVGAMASFATSRVSENAGIANTDNFDAAVGALNDKFDTQTNEVVGLKGEFDTLKDDLMGAMAQLAMAVTSGEGAEKESEKFQAAVNAFGEKLEAQAGEVVGLKEELNSLKDELMNAMTQLAVSVAPDETAAASETEKLENAVGALYEKLEAQASEMGGLKEEMSSLKDDLLNAMTQLASSSASADKADARAESAQAADHYGEKLRAEMQTLNEKMHSEMESLKDELMGAMAQLAVSVAPDANAGNGRDEKLEEAVGSLNRKIDTQAAEVGGLKNELLEAMAQIGMAVSSAPDSKSDFMALKQELVRSQDANEAMEREYTLQFDRAIDTMNARMQNEIDRLKSDLLNAISGLEVKSSAKTSFRAEDQNAVSRESTEKIASAVDQLNTNLDTQMGTLKDELLCAITQVGMAVFNAPDKNDFASFKEQIAKSSNSFTPAASGADGRFEEIADNLNERIEAQMSVMKEDVLDAISEIKASAPASENKAADSLINYDWLAEKLAQKVPVIDYDFMAKRVKDLMPEQPASSAEATASTGVAANAGGEETFEIDYDLLAEKIAAIVPEVDYDDLAERIAGLMPQADEKAGDNKAATAAKRTAPVGDEEPFEIDYDLLAEKIAIIIPEVDYDELADRIANMIPQADENAIADKVASVIPQTDEDEIADKVADAIPLVDYDLIASKVAEKVLGSDYDDLQERIKSSREEVDYDELAEKFASKVSSGNFFTTVDRIANVRNDEPEEIDYDLLADKVAERLPETDYDEIADRLAQRVSAADGEAVKTEKTHDEANASAVEIDYDVLAEKVAAKMPAFDYDEISSRLKTASAFVSAKTAIDYDELAEHMNVTASDIPAPEMAVDYDLLAEVLAQKVPTVDYDEISERIKVALEANAESEGVDYDKIAERVSMILPEVDYDTIAERVASVVGSADEEAIASKIAAAMPQADGNAIAAKVAGSIPSINYDLLADRVARMLENEFDVTVDDTGISKIARTVSEEIDYNKVAETVVEMLKKEDLFKKSAPAPEVEKEVKTAAEEEAVIASAPQQSFAPAYSYAPQPAYNYAPQPAPQPAYNYAPQPNYNYAPQPAPQQAQPAPQQPQPAPKFPFGTAPKKEKPAKRTEAPSAKPAPITDDGEEENEQTTRFKRSFIARIIQSDEETKAYYSKLKNAILQYARTNSQVNWSNDRFSYAGETIAKIGVNGKSLCMYIALNPDEFSTSVYHQKFEGDKKMYEKTPMMVKIKSEVGLKRALRLIPLLMEKLGATAGEKKNVDYAAMYPFKTDDELLEEGLIKMQATAKTGFNF